ncbi:hypothetical protein ACVZHT_21550, partial [Vibrio diabolicus]
EVVVQVAAQFTPTDLTISHTSFGQQTLSIGPIWLANGDLFAVLALTHPDDQITVVSAWLSALVGRMSCDISSHYQK